MLKYKCQWYGKELVKADRFFTSSKICSHCNQYNKCYGQEVNPEFNLSKYNKIPEYWTCSHCESSHNRDENACKNLIQYDELNALDKKSTKNQSRVVNKSTAEMAGLPLGNSMRKDSKTELLLVNNQQSERVAKPLHPETVQYSESITDICSMVKNYLNITI